MFTFQDFHIFFCRNDIIDLIDFFFFNAERNVHLVK